MTRRGTKFYGQMCKKTVLRQLVTLLPQPAGVVMDVPPELAPYVLEPMDPPNQPVEIRSL